jgi:hypothetical protein
VPIYAISNRGLVAPGSGSNPLRPVRLAKRGNDFLQSVANSSGGFAVLNTNNPLPGIEQVLLENSHRYVIAYEATYPVEDGRYRRLEIRVDRKDVTVFPSGQRIRLAKPPERKLVLSPRAAIAGILPIADVPMAVRVALPTASPSERMEVSLDLEIGPVDGVEVDAEVECVAFDASRLNEHGSASARVPLAAGGPSTARLRLTLAPGRYNLRCGVHAPAAGKLGSVYTHVTVPAR